MEIVKNPDFDPSEFFSVPNTQVSTFSSQPLAELEEQDLRINLFPSSHSQDTIPDSQDNSGNSLSQRKFSNPESHPPVSPIQSQDSATQERHQDDASATLGIDSHIPSRQPQSLILESNQLRGYTNPESRITSFAQATSAAVEEAESAPSNPTQDPVYFTQPAVTHFFEEPPSPLSSLNDEAARDVVVESTPNIHNRPRAKTPTESQGAQIQQHHFSSVDIISDSNSTADQGTATMSEEQSGRKERPSAVDELRNAFTLNSPTEEDRNVGTLVDEGTADETNNVQQVEAVVDKLDEPMASGALDGAVLNTEPPPRLSATQELHNIVDMAFSQPLMGTPSATLDSEPDLGVPPTTITPADIVGIDPSQGVAPSDIFEGSSNVVSMHQPEQPDLSSRTSRDGSVGPVPMQHVVTLPFQSSLRPTYDETLLEQRRAVTNFGEIFSASEYVEPDTDLVDKIDKLLNHLYNICDYPQDVVGSSLEHLPPVEQSKYVCDANSKFSFVFELLQGIETDTSFLIVAGTPELLRILCNLTTALEIDYTAEAIDEKSTTSDSAASVTFILADQDFDTTNTDVVVGFDHSFRQSPVAKALSAREIINQPPLLLTLVTTHSIEHIDLEIPGEMHPLQRRNALLAGIVGARKLVDDPDRGYPEPHELASLFYMYLNGKADTILWEPIPIPAEVLDIYESSQTKSQFPSTIEPDNSRKRKLEDDEDDTDEETKRPRTYLEPKFAIAGLTEPPLPDEVVWMLESVKGEAQIKDTDAKTLVPLSALQALAEKVAELERQREFADAEAEYKSAIEGLSKRVKEYERTSSKIYKAHRMALQDRSKYEASAKSAEAALLKAKEQTQKDADKAQAKITELEEQIARLVAPQDGSEDSPLAVSEKLLKEAQANAKRLEERVKLAQNEAEYARVLYQDGSADAATVRGENIDLKKENEELKQKNSDSLASVHKINAEASIAEYLSQIKALAAQLRDRESEVDRVRDELRQLRSVRRDTRQSSVPRSPRMGMMSPRPARANPTSASRGTSPAPLPGIEGGPPSTSAPPNARWNHLRD